jgi:hypothetical protein
VTFLLHVDLRAHALDQRPPQAAEFSAALFAADLHPRKPLVHLDERRAVFLAESSGAPHLVDLLGHVGEEERYAEALRESRFEFLVLERYVERAARRPIVNGAPRSWPMKPGNFRDVQFRGVSFVLRHDRLRNPVPNRAR